MKEFCEKWWKRIATKEMVFIGIVTLLASVSYTHLTLPTILLV